MSLSATIDIHFALPVQAVQVVQLFDQHGWTWRDTAGQVFYLPLHDVDEYSWQLQPFTDEDLFSLIGLKQQAGEVVGLSMYWQDSGVGADFVFFAPDQLSLHLMINRQQLPNSRMTDFSWYLPRILPVLDAAGYQYNYTISESA